MLSFHKFFWGLILVAGGGFLMWALTGCALPMGTGSTGDVEQPVQQPVQQPVEQSGAVAVEQSQSPTTSAVAVEAIKTVIKTGSLEPAPSGTCGTGGTTDMTGKITWAQSGNLITGDPNGSVNLQTGDLGDREYRYYTVQFTTDPPGDGSPFAAIATVTYSVNGNPIVRQLSVGQGVAISGAADSIVVRVVDSTPTGTATGAQYGVTITCCPGTRAPNGEPLLIMPGEIAVPPGGAISVPVPQGVGIIGMWISATTASGDDPKEVVSEISTALISIFTFGLNSPTPIRVPVPPGTVSIDIEDNQPGEDTGVSIIWIIEG